MSLRIVGHSRDGHRVVIDEGPNQAKLRSRGGLALGQALTATGDAADVKPVGVIRQGTAPEIVLRGEALLAKRRQRR